METDVYKQIGRRVAELREARGLTQERLAEKASMSRSHVARIESGGRQATVERLNAIARALGIPLWRLFADNRLSMDERAWGKRALQLAEALRNLTADDVELLAAFAERLTSK